MQFKKIVPYKIKKLIPMLGMAGATLFMGGCDKEETIVQHDEEVKVHQFEFNKLFDTADGVLCPSTSIQEMLKDPSVRTVYLVPDGSWTNFFEKNIITLRVSILEPLLNFSPKLRGKGDFNFAEGEASKIPEDSLWYLNNGWTVNKRFIEQKQH